MRIVFKNSLATLILLVTLSGCSQKRIDVTDIRFFDEKTSAGDEAYRIIDKDLDALQSELKAVERVFGKPLDKIIYVSLNDAKQAVKNKDYQESRKLYQQTVDLARDHLVDGTAINEYRQALENIGRRLEDKAPCVEAWDVLRALRLKTALRRIIIPEVTFDPPATLIDAVDFFKQASRDHDDPKMPVQQRGVSFVLKLPASSTTAGSGVDPFAVSSDSKKAIQAPVIPHISARFISLYDALKLVCDVTGFKFETRGGFVMITPVTDPER